jgi:hypothetical protein
MNKFSFIQLFVIGLLLTFTNSCKKEATTGKVDPIMFWEKPADITYGTLLTIKQLNATANTPGTFFYTPPLNTKLNSGENRELKVDFTPSDLANYNVTSMIVKINVKQIGSEISWSNPSDIYVGMALSEIQLNAKYYSTTGTFEYNPPIGTKLNEGLNQELKVDFTSTNLVI